jgi:hypothetical protein
MGRPNSLDGDINIDSLDGVARYSAREENSPAAVVDDLRLLGTKVSMIATSVERERKTHE